ncbi:hypothetical protein T492DRAFT_182313 [Pavlovales sp. CCMP2436]|nr:hypothetical protein T492DRAFT_182313 [Pavlovales sp. CCMP2436]
MLALFSTPDEPGLSELCASIAAAVRARVPRLAAGGDAAELSRAMLAWLLSSHATACAESGREGAAIFALGHRCNHSCEPNAVYAPGGAHRLRLRALRPIVRGEAVCCSYLVQHELLMPCTLRRKMLTARKNFRCACARCRRDDDAEPERGLRCACGASTAVAGGGAWLCGGCGSRAGPSAGMLAREQELCALAMRDEMRSSDLELELWAGHWVHCAALWREGIDELRAALSVGDVARARRSWPLLVRTTFKKIY